MWFQITTPADDEAVDRVVAAARAASPRCRDTVVIAIDGKSGSGKTSLAKGVVDALGCPVVHMDELFPGWDGLAEAVPLVTSQVLEPISRGEPAAYRMWDWPGHRWGETKSIATQQFLVIEGCGSSVGSAGEYAALRVWVEAPRALRRARGLARDGEMFRAHWERWEAQEDALYAADRTRDHADLIIATDGPPPAP